MSWWGVLGLRCWHIQVPPVEEGRSRTMDVLCCGRFPGAVEIDLLHGSHQRTPVCADCLALLAATNPDVAAQIRLGGTGG